MKCLAPGRYDYEYYEEIAGDNGRRTIWEVSVSPGDEGVTIRLSFQQTGGIDDMRERLKRSAEKCDVCADVLTRYGLNRVYMNEKVFERIVAFVQNVLQQRSASS